MRLKTILVCLMSPDQAEALMNVAVPLARKHGAHLIGLHTIEALVVYPGTAMHIPQPVYVSFNESQKEVSAAIKKIFDRTTKNEDFLSEFRLLRSDSVSPSDRIIESARAADLVMMSQVSKSADRYHLRQVQSDVIRACGRPVVVVPTDYDGPAIGRNIVLGWSDTREAARAAHDLLIVADQGAAITVLRVEKQPSDALKDFDGIDLTAMYARHDLTATLKTYGESGTSISDALNKVAFEKGADLIVTGAFGHSRFYDFVIGATTHALLSDAKYPVMFSK